MRNDELVRLKAEIRDLSRQLSWESSKRLELQFEIERIKDVISKCDIGFKPIDEVKAQRPDVDNAHVIAAEMSRKLTKEELTATPLNDLRIVSEIKERFSERMTKNIEKYFGDERFEHTALMGVYMRLKEIEDIIYGEENEQ